MAKLTVRLAALLAALSLAPAALARPDGWSTGWTAFDPRPDGRVVLPVSVDGHAATALLDSGASESVIDRDYAGLIGLEPHGAYTNNGVSGRQTSGNVDGARIEVGGLALNGLTLASLELGESAPPSRPVILGEELFERAVVDIDFAHHRIAFHDPARFVRPRGATEVPLTRDGELRLVPVSVEGRPPALFEFDLGAGGTIVLAPAYTREANLLAGRPTSRGAIYGVGGPETETRAILRQVAFAGTRFADVDAHFPSTWPSGTFSARVKGVLGATILSRFHLIVDYPHDRLYVVADPNPASR
jgi:predicted aspartyl protease